MLGQFLRFKNHPLMSWLTVSTVKIFTTEHPQNPVDTRSSPRRVVIRVRRWLFRLTSADHCLGTGPPAAPDRVAASYNGLFGINVRPMRDSISTTTWVALAPSFHTRSAGYQKIAHEWKKNRLAILFEKKSALEKTVHWKIRDPAKRINNVVIGQTICSDQVAPRKSAKSASCKTWREQGCFPKESVLEIDTQTWKTSETFRATLQGAENSGDLNMASGIESLKESDDVGQAFVSLCRQNIQLRFEWCKTISDADVACGRTNKRQRFTGLARRRNRSGSVLITSRTTPGLAPYLMHSDGPKASCVIAIRIDGTCSTLQGWPGLPSGYIYRFVP